MTAIATPRIRGRAHQRIVARIRRRANGLCEQCLEQGRTVPGEEVDHRVPLYKGGAEDDSNRWLLCDPCHTEKTALDLEHKPKGADASGRPTDPRHHWNTTP